MPSLISLRIENGTSWCVDVDALCVQIKPMALLWSCCRNKIWFKYFVLLLLELRAALHYLIGQNLVGKKCLNSKLKIQRVDKVKKTRGMFMSYATFIYHRLVHGPSVDEPSIYNCWIWVIKENNYQPYITTILPDSGTGFNLYSTNLQNDSEDQKILIQMAIIAMARHILKIFQLDS